ncbi:MAG: Crp/Fnr family transcriptional regulator [Acidobacteria bacterium]|nr:MAG: Crp/Fnr family transcriptional regulator [Acidobacteriota bacterium]
MTTNPRPPTKFSLPPTFFDTDGNRIHNELLVGLPAKESQILFPRLEFVRLPTHHVLHEPGDTLKSGFFCNSGLVSILSVFPDGKSVEVGLVGKEGFVGLPMLAGFRSASTQALVQIEATAFRMNRETLINILRQCPALERRLQQFGQMMTVQTMQIAACNRLHDVDQRLARWLLMTADRIESNSVPLTQEFLAHMLGTRRSSVTVAAGILQKAELISHSRGDLEIINRPKLEDAACECYGILRRQIEKWLGEVE